MKSPTIKLAKYTEPQKAKPSGYTLISVLIESSEQDPGSHRGWQEGN